MQYQPVLLPAVREMLNARRGNWRQIAEEAGVPYHTMQKIAQGQVDNPGVNTIERLHTYLTRETAA